MAIIVHRSKFWPIFFLYTVRRAECKRVVLYEAYQSRIHCVQSMFECKINKKYLHVFIFTRVWFHAESVKMSTPWNIPRLQYAKLPRSVPTFHHQTDERLNWNFWNPFQCLSFSQKGKICLIPEHCNYFKSRFLALYQNLVPEMLLWSVPEIPIWWHIPTMIWGDPPHLLVWQRQLDMRFKLQVIFACFFFLQKTGLKFWNAYNLFKNLTLSKSN